MAGARIDQWWTRTRRWLAEHPLATDLGVAAVVLALSLAFFQAEQLGADEREPGALALSLIIAMAAALLWRRTAPVVVTYVIGTGTCAYWILNYPDGPAGVALITAYYALGRYKQRRAMIAHGIWITMLILAVVTVGVLIPDEDVPVLAVPTNLIALASALAFGDSVRNRAAYIHELEERIRSDEAQKAAQASRAVAEERTRIARELHDVVAHSMSVIVVQAGAARRVLDDRPAQAAEALEAIESTGRQSLEEMRALLGVLRNEDDIPSTAPQPTLGDMAALVETFDEAGVPVSTEVRGDTASLSAAAQLTLYRVAQEALTNVLKHAGQAARAAVSLEIADRRATLEVCDDGLGAAASSADGEASSRGHGLLGMRERVEALSGSFFAGPQRGGGFRVLAEIPVETS